MTRAPQMTAAWRNVKWCNCWWQRLKWLSHRQLVLTVLTVLTKRHTLWASDLTPCGALPAASSSSPRRRGGGGGAPGARHLFPWRCADLIFDDGHRYRLGRLGRSGTFRWRGRSPPSAGSRWSCSCRWRPGRCRPSSPFRRWKLQQQQHKYSNDIAN